jgi:hypothetical protein
MSERETDESVTVYLCHDGIVYRTAINDSEAVELEGLMKDLSFQQITEACEDEVFEWMVISSPEREHVFIPGIGRKTPFSPEEWTLQLLRCVSD